MELPAYGRIMSVFLNATDNLAIDLLIQNILIQGTRLLKFLLNCIGKINELTLPILETFNQTTQYFFQPKMKFNLSGVRPEDFRKELILQAPASQAGVATAELSLLYKFIIRKFIYLFNFF